MKVFFPLDAEKNKEDIKMACMKIQSVVAWVWGWGYYHRKGTKSVLGMDGKALDLICGGGGHMQVYTLV